MADVTVLHNPRCTKSCAALTAAEEAGVDVDVVRYLDEPLDADAVRALLAKLEDAPAALVRRAAVPPDLHNGSGRSSDPSGRGRSRGRATAGSKFENASVR